MNLVTIYDYHHSRFICLVCLLLSGLMGCSGGYKQAPLFPTDIESIRLEMFDNASFHRSIEYTLSDALAKRLGVDTPYRIVTHQDRADSIISGQIHHVREAVLSAELETGKALEKEMVIRATVTWKNLQTGSLLLDAVPVETSVTYSNFIDQGTGYAYRLGANKLAQQIVERMEQQW